MREVFYYARRYPLGVAGALIMMLFVLTAVFANVVAPLDPMSTNARASLAPPSGTYLMGADMMGRDVLSRMIHGARISLAVALGATCIGSGLGAMLGLASGYSGGWFDLIVQRIAEIMQSLPLLVMALVITASLGPSLVNTIIAIAIPLIPNVARVIRANVLSLRELNYVEAARAVGMKNGRIALVHVFPNTLAPLIVLATAQLGSTILTEASACRSHTPPGAACCPNRRRNISAALLGW
jgi:peptide/nickel transport system permease protein